MNALAPPKKRAAVLGPPIQKPTAQYYHWHVGAQGIAEYGALHTFLGYLLRLFDAINRFLTYLRRPLIEFSLWVEELRSRIETASELDKWNWETIDQELDEWIQRGDKDGTLG